MVGATKPVVVALALTLALVGILSGCISLPEYTVSVEADPGVRWWGWLSVSRYVGDGERRSGTRIPPDESQGSALGSWELTLRHEYGDGFGEGGRIVGVSLQVFKAGGEGSVRVWISRDGEVVAEGETSETGAAAHCEFSAGP